MRISTNSIMRNYRGNLNKSANQLNSAREKVLTDRKFSKASEDPAGATKAFQLRREYLQNEDYMDNIGEAQGQLSATESSLMQVNDMGKEIKSGILRAVNGGTSTEGRVAIAQNFEAMAESMVMSMNVKFADKFLFGGASTKEVPFKLEGDTLLYRGIDVNTTDPDKLSELQAMSKETNYMDLGFGMRKDANGEIIKGTAQNTSNPGIAALGFGTNDEGVSQNLVTLILDMSKELKKEPFDQDLMQKMSKQFDKNFNKNIDKVTELGSVSKFLENTENRLLDSRLNLNEKMLKVENVDKAEAITQFSWAEYSYNAALKVGNSILSQSFIDFMR
ncbi:MAG: hypothetical protein WBH44_02115 [Proteocatella sp.]